MPKNRRGKRDGIERKSEESSVGEITVSRGKEGEKRERLFRINSTQFSEEILGRNRGRSKYAYLLACCFLWRSAEEQSDDAASAAQPPPSPLFLPLTIFLRLSRPARVHSTSLMKQTWSRERLLRSQTDRDSSLVLSLYSIFFLFVLICIFFIPCVPCSCLIKCNLLIFFSLNRTADILRKQILHNFIDMLFDFLKINQYEKHRFLLD